jgi:hypothetical protein
MDSTPTTQKTTNTEAAASTQQTTRSVTDQQKSRQDGEQRPYRARGEFRGNYRGRQTQDGEERPFVPRGRGERGRGRGGYNREGETVTNENGEQVQVAYKDRPRFQTEDGTFRGNYRGRNYQEGEERPFVRRGRGEGYRGRGGATVTNENGEQVQVDRPRFQN